LEYRTARLNTFGTLNGEDDSSLNSLMNTTSLPPLNDLSDMSDLILPPLSELGEISVPKDSQLAPPVNSFPLTSQTPSFPMFSPMVAKAESPTPEPKEKKRRKSINKQLSQEDRAVARKIKHRLIDRARRRRVKDSIDQLKDLVRFESHERPDKATVVSSAVREIQDLKQQIVNLQTQVARLSVKATPAPTTFTSSPTFSPTSTFLGAGSDSEIPESPPRTEEKSPQSAPCSLIPSGSSQAKLTGLFHLQSFLAGLGGAGVMAVLYGLDCLIKDVNGLFETITGFRREEVVNSRYRDAPLYGRHVHGEYPMRFERSPDPSQLLIPTASKSDLTCTDFKRAVNALVHGGTFKVVSRLLTRDGQILESLNTTFLLRNERNEPVALVALSTPDCRRFVHLNHRQEEQTDVFMELPSISSNSPTTLNALVPDFLTPLASQS